MPTTKLYFGPAGPPALWLALMKVCRFLILYDLASRLNGILALATCSFPSYVMSANVYGYREAIEALFVIGSLVRMQVPFIEIFLLQF